MALQIPVTAGFVGVDTTSAKTVELPFASERQGRLILIKDRTGNAAQNPILIQTKGGDTFEDGGTTYRIRNPFGSVQFISRGSQWLRANTIEPTTSSLSLSTGSIFASTITADGRFLYNLPAISTASLQSTVQGLGTISYISSQQLLSTTKGIQNFISTVVAVQPNTSGEVLYLNYSTTVNSYKQLAISAKTAGLSIINSPINAFTSNVILTAFESDFQLPTFIPGGIWDINLFAYTTIDSLVSMYANLYTRTTGVETLIASSSNSPTFLNVSPVAQYDILLNVPYTNVSTNTSIVLKLFGTNADTNTQTIYTYYEDSYYSHVHTTFGFLLPNDVLNSTIVGLGTAGYASTIALQQVSNYFMPLTAVNISSGLSTVALFTSNTSNFSRNILQDFSTPLSTVALFTSNTSNFSRNILQDFSTPLSTVALFTSNTSNFSRNILQDFSTPLSTVALFTSNTSNFSRNILQDFSTPLSTVALFTSNTSNFSRNILQDFSTSLSTVALFTSNTSNFFLNNAGGTGVSSLFGVVSSGLSTVALFTSNTSNFSRNILQDFSTPISTVALFTSNTSNYAANILQNYSSFLFSTTIGLATAGYISSFSLQSTVQGLGRIYISTNTGASSSNVNAFSISTGTLYASSMSFVNINPSTINLWIASGEDSPNFTNRLRYSFDGITWSNIAFANYVNSLAWNGNMWVAAVETSPSTNTLAYSYNGINWSNSSGLGFSSRGWGVGWNGRMWVAVGQDANTNNTIQYSFNGINWSNSAGSGFSTAGYGVAWNGRIWVAVGNDITPNNRIKYSLDGINWSNSAGTAFSGIAYKLAWNGRLWVAVGQDSTANNTIKYSFDGISWANSAGSGFTSYGRSVAWNGRLWVAVGDDFPQTSNIKYSYDGINWSNSSANFTNRGQDVAWNGQLWIAIGWDTVKNNTIKYSYDGFTWSNSSGNGFAPTGIAIAFSSNTIPAYSQSNLSILSQNIPLFLTSTNTIFNQPSSMIINDALIIDGQWDRVGINCNIPQYSLDVNGNVNVSTLSIQSTPFQTLIGSTIQGLGNIYLSSGGGGGLTQANITSTIDGLGTYQYISSLSLQSTTRGLGNIYLSTSLTQTNLTSTIDGLGTTSYISSLSLQSTLQGLGNLYLSTALTQTNLTSTVIGLGTTSYISSLSLQSTTRGLGNIYLSTGGGFVNGQSNFFSSVSTTQLFANTVYFGLIFL